MKKTLIALLLLIFILSDCQLKSQDIKSGKNITVEYINSLLKNNPYTDNFQEITFFYSIEITPENELVVNLEYDGPFRSNFRSKISDLNPVPQNNSTMIQSTYLCWQCKSVDSGGHSSCVQNEIIYTSGEKELHTAGEISVMFSNDKKVYSKLFDAFDKLFSQCSVKVN
jgi:hypothetical protein